MRIYQRRPTSVRQDCSTLEGGVVGGYGELPEDSIRALLSFRDLADDDREMLERVIENAKMYFKTPDDFDRVWREELGDEEE